MADFAWTNPKTSGSNFNLTVSEWNSYITALNDKRTQLGYSSLPSCSLLKGDSFTATIFNNVVQGLKDIKSDTTVPSNVVKGNNIYAWYFNKLRDDLNSVVVNLDVWDIKLVLTPSTTSNKITISWDTTNITYFKKVTIVRATGSNIAINTISDGTIVTYSNITGVASFDDTTISSDTDYTYKAFIECLNDNDLNVGSGKSLNSAVYLSDSYPLPMPDECLNKEGVILNRSSTQICLNCIDDLPVGVHIINNGKLVRSDGGGFILHQYYSDKQSDGSWGAWYHQYTGDYGNLEDSWVSLAQSTLDVYNSTNSSIYFNKNVIKRVSN